MTLNKYQDLHSIIGQKNISREPGSVNHNKEVVKHHELDSYKNSKYNDLIPD